MAKQNWKPGNMLYPVPAVMVSCQRPGEKPNIVTIAWAGTICSDPAMVSISVRPERYSYDIIKETGEFTINLVTEKLAFATDYCGVKSGRDVDKFKEMNLHACDGVNVSCPAIEESPVNVECKVKQVVELGSHHMFIAEVVGVQISDEYMDKTGNSTSTARDLSHIHMESILHLATNSANLDILLEKSDRRLKSCRGNVTDRRENGNIIKGIWKDKPRSRRGQET